MIVFILPVLPRPARLPFRSFIGYGNGDTAHQVANSWSALDDPVPSPTRIDGWPLGPWANPKVPNSSRRDTPAQCRRWHPGAKIGARFRGIRLMFLTLSQ